MCLLPYIIEIQYFRQTKKIKSNAFFGCEISNEADSEKDDECRERESLAEAYADTRYDKLYEIIVAVFGKTRTWIRIHNVQLRNKCSTYQPRETKPADGTECAKGNIFYIIFLSALSCTKIYHLQRRGMGKWVLFARRTCIVFQLHDCLRLKFVA